MADIDDRWYWRDRKGTWHRTARYGVGQRWLVRWRDPDGRQRKRSFRRKADAQVYATSTEHDLLSGSYIDPDSGKITVGEWSRLWFDAQAHLKPSTAARYESIIAKHVLPAWESWQLSSMRHSGIQQWVSELAKKRSAETVAKTYRVLSLMLSSAVRDGRLARNPADGIRLPRPSDAEHRYLTPTQVRELAEACGSDGLVIRLLAYTGLRWGELAALRVGRVQAGRRRVYVTESVTEVNGKLSWGEPKTHERRAVPLSRSLAGELAHRIAGKSSDALVFASPQGKVLRVRNFRRKVFDSAVKAVGPKGLHPHELRHTAASLAIASGADVKVVQQMLGHKTATMTLDQYGHLFPDRLDEVADRMDGSA